MPLGNTLPYGLRDVKITPYTTGETIATTSLDLPVSRVFTFTEAETFDELRGDDGLVTVRGQGPSIQWDLESGGYSFPVINAMFGGTLTSSGTTPAQVNLWRKLGTDQRPFFKVEGQSISDNGGDFHAVIYKCRATSDFKGTLGDAQWTLMTTSGTGVSRQTAITGPPAVPAGVLYDLVQNETAVAIP